MTPRFRMLSDATLRQFVAALELCPAFAVVVDLRIAARNELWRRSTEADRSNAWLVSAVRDWN